MPVAYGHRDVWIRGYVDRVVIGCGGEVISRHPRCYGREDMVFDPIRYLSLLEQKIGALDRAAPLVDWELPAEFDTLRRLMEARLLKAGRREYVQVLRLLETFDLADLHVAVKTALEAWAPSASTRSAPGAVPGRETAAEARPRRLPLPAARQRRHHFRVQPHVPRRRSDMSDAPKLLLDHHLKTLKLPTFLREYAKLARPAA